MLFRTELQGYRSLQQGQPLGLPVGPLGHKPCGPVPPDSPLHTFMASHRGSELGDSGDGGGGGGAGPAASGRLLGDFNAAAGSHSGGGGSGGGGPTGGAGTAPQGYRGQPISTRGPVGSDAGGGGAGGHHHNGPMSPLSR